MSTSVHCWLDLIREKKLVDRLLWDNLLDRESNLSNAKLNRTILLSVNLASTKNLTQQQLDPQQQLDQEEKEDLPLLCNVHSPPEISVNRNRDCDRLPQELVKRYPEKFKSLEESKHFVNQKRQRSSGYPRFQLHNSLLQVFYHPT